MSTIHLHLVRNSVDAWRLQDLNNFAPEESAWDQSFRDIETELEIWFDGRLDNRSQLLSQLRDLVKQGTSLSDSRLALAAFHRWGERCFDRLLGSFAVVFFDRRNRRLVAGRDAIGNRTLCYHLGEKRLILASEASAVRQHPGVSDELDEPTLASFFAVEAPPIGATFFKEVRELPPGHYLLYSGKRLEIERFWRPTDLQEVRYRDDREYVEHFRSLLEDCVRCRMPSAGPPAVLMSGGLDSTSVAAVATRELGEVGRDARLPAVSWVFDELAGADERRFMDPVVQRFELSAHRIHADREWPLRDLASWPVNPNAPWQGLYCRLQDRSYAVARDAGSGVLLTGEYGDHLFQDGPWWLRDLLFEGRWMEALGRFRQEIGDRSVWTVLRGGPARGALARVLGWRGRWASRPMWLTRHARRLLDNLELDSHLACARGRQSRPGVLDPMGAHGASLETSSARRAGVEVRRPYRDRRLIEFVLSIPAHLFYRPPWTKWILRQAMEGILPEPVRLRRHISSLLPLAVRGLLERESDSVRKFLEAPDALWRRYVRADWLAKAFPRRLQQGLDGVESVVPWQCICSQLWLQRSGLHTS